MHFGSAFQHQIFAGCNRTNGKHRKGSSHLRQACVRQIAALRRILSEMGKVSTQSS